MQRTAGNARTGAMLARAPGAPPGAGGTRYTHTHRARRPDADRTQCGSSPPCTRRGDRTATEVTEAGDAGHDQRSAPRLPTPSPKHNRPRTDSRSRARSRYRRPGLRPEKKRPASHSEGPTWPLAPRPREPRAPHHQPQPPARKDLQLRKHQRLVHPALSLRLVQPALPRRSKRPQRPPLLVPPRRLPKLPLRRRKRRRVPLRRQAHLPRRKQKPQSRLHRAKRRRPQSVRSSRRAAGARKHTPAGAAVASAQAAAKQPGTEQKPLRGDATVTSLDSAIDGSNQVARETFKTRVQGRDRSRHAEAEHRRPGQQGELESGANTASTTMRAARDTDGRRSWPAEESDCSRPVAV